MTSYEVALIIRPDVEEEAQQSLIERLSQLLTDFPEIKELDINPLRVFHEALDSTAKHGCRALDARMILE